MIQSRGCPFSRASTVSDYFDTGCMSFLYLLLITNQVTFEVPNFKGSLLLEGSCCRDNCFLSNFFVKRNTSLSS